MTKSIIIGAALSLGILTLAEAQNFSGRTNEIVIDYKNPSNQALVTNLPVITWQNPQQEFTNSTSESVELQALITSDIEIRSIRILLGDGNASRGEKTVESGAVKEYKLKQHLKLLDGQNVIEIVVENVKGGVVSSTR